MASSALATVGGLNVLHGELNMPRTGVWHVDCELDSTGASPTPLTGLQTVTWGSLAGKATILRCDVYRNTTYARLAGGSGNLSTAVQPKGYFSVPFSTPLTDVLTQAGYSINAQTSQTVLGFPLNAWGTTAGSCGLNLANLLRKVPPVQYQTWRIMLDGTFWMGTDSFPINTDADVTVLDYTPALYRVEIGEDAPSMLPGQSFAPVSGGPSFLIDYVSYRITPEKTRGLFWFLP